MFEGLHDHEDDEDIDEVVEGFSGDDEMFDERRRRRVPVFGPGIGIGMAPFFPGSLQPSGSGVQTATLTTPRGSATVRLPEAVATERALKDAMGKLEATLNGLATQVSANRAAIADARAASASAHSQLAARHKKLALAAKASLQKLRKQQQMSMMLTAAAAALVQRENDKRFNAHVHTAINAVPSVPANKNLSLLLLAPMLPALIGSGSKMISSDMTPLLVAGGLAFFLLRDPAPAAAK